VISLKEDDRGLFGEWKLIDATRGADAYKLLKARTLDSMSIGLVVNDHEFEPSPPERILHADRYAKVSTSAPTPSPSACGVCASHASERARAQLGTIGQAGLAHLR
jgi:HK97 family phage prohead protease